MSCKKELKPQSSSTIFHVMFIFRTFIIWFPKLTFYFLNDWVASPTNRITTGATARLGGIPLPFVGTNNQPACQRIVSKQSRQSVGCNTNAGEVYTYSNTFPILQIYPVVRHSNWLLLFETFESFLAVFLFQTSVTVQWELLDHNRQKITCFTIPARIV